MSPSKPALSRGVGRYQAGERALLPVGKITDNTHVAVLQQATVIKYVHACCLVWEAARKLFGVLATLSRSPFWASAALCEMGMVISTSQNGPEG